MRTATACTIAIACWFSSLSAFQQSPRLSLGAVEALVENHTPDEVITGEIKDRGLQFVPSRELVDRLRDLGAGSATLTVLSELIPDPLLIIDAGLPDCEVFVDGGRAGQTGPTGTLAVQALGVGTHQILVRKLGYVDFTSSVSLAASGTTARTMLIRATNLPPTVPAVRRSVAPTANLRALLEKKDYASFRAQATIALDEGADVIVNLDLMHHHCCEVFHSIRLEIRSAGLYFNPEEGVKGKPSLISAARIQRVQLFRIRQTPVLLAIFVSNASKPNKTDQYSFAIANTVRDNPCPSCDWNLWTSPPGAEEQLTAVAWLVEQVRSRAVRQ